MRSDKHGRRHRKTSIWVEKKFYYNHRCTMSSVVIAGSEPAREHRAQQRDMYKETAERGRSIPRSRALGHLRRARGSTFRYLFSSFPVCPLLSMASLRPSKTAPFITQGATVTTFKAHHFSRPRFSPTTIILLVTLPIYAYICFNAPTT